MISESHRFTVQRQEVGPLLWGVGCQHRQEGDGCPLMPQRPVSSLPGSTRPLNHKPKRELSLARA